MIKYASKFTLEKAHEIFKKAENMEGDFKTIEKKLFGHDKGFGYLVSRYPEFRKRMYQLMIRCEQLN